MALKFRRVKKSFGFDKSKTEKYLVVPERATPVGFGYLCEEIAMVSGVNKGKPSFNRDILYRWKGSGALSHLLMPRVALWKVRPMRIPSER